MVGSGTIKTLAALVAALTIGTSVLIWMETDPARPKCCPHVSLEALEADGSGSARAIIGDTDVPLQPVKWRNIIVHDAGQDGPGVARGCHFLIAKGGDPDGGPVRSTRLWRWQEDGKHISVPGYRFNDNSIGICLLRDCRRVGPTSEQFKALMKLIRSLQATFRIPHGHVYLHSDLGKAGCPGGFFPVEDFRRRLLRPAR